MSADPPTFDLQSHSLHSDGALEPATSSPPAAQAGVETARAERPRHGRRRAGGARRGVERSGSGSSPAVEISSVDRDQQDLHVLGYLVDHNDAVLRDRLRTWRDDRERRADAMAAALRELGYEVDESELERRKAEGKPIGRPHLADAVVRHPANEQRLRDEGLDERSAFLEAYLIDGKPAFKPRTTPTVAESIAAIHDAGGVAVWAHPFWDVADARRGARDDRPLPRTGASTASSASTPPTPASRPSCSPTAVPSSGCSAPAPRTSTGRRTAVLDGSARSATGVIRASDLAASDCRRPRRGSAGTSAGRSDVAARPNRDMQSTTRGGD